MATLRSLSYLPSIFRTETNRKFLGSTLDQLISDPKLQKVSAFVGRTFAPSWQSGDSYVQEPTTTRQEYQLEPSLILTDDTTGLIDSVITYPDLINKLAYYNVPVDNHSRLFENEYYNFDGLVDPDKFINYYQYYWLPNGPDSVQISAINVPFVETFNVSSSAVYDGIGIDKYGDQYNPTITLVQGGTYTFTTDSSVPEFWIQTQPGLSGFSSSLSTIPTRNILGVTNNGATANGTLTFTVPQPNAQNNFINMPIAATVNIACGLTYAQLADMPVSTIIAAGGIDGLQYFNNKTIIFTTQSNAPADWTSSQTQSVVAQNQRFGVWSLTIDNSNIVRLTFKSSIPVLNKVNVLEGDTYANQYFYRAPNFAQTLELVPTITANLSTLYYQSTTDANQYGVINIVATQADAVINVTNEILGRSNYTSPNGVQFTNGLKVTFDANVLPVSYQYSTCYVDGVGSSISLSPVQDFVTPEVGVEYPDYITMNRSSACLNAWTRSNRWFHIDVINSTANYNNTSPVVDQSARAIRPILEFDPNLQLFNSNATFLASVDLIDFTLTDAFSTVNGALGFFLDGLEITAGMKILFAADSNPLVANTVYEVDFINIHQTGEPQINLTAYATAVSGSGVVVLSGNNFAGQSFYYNGSEWLEAQQKISINQPIKFDVFDANGASFGDPSVYPGTTFSGTNVFGYTVGSGPVDPVLNFPLTYQVFNNIGDILFTDFYDSDTFTYLLDSTTTQLDVNTGFIHLVDTSSELGYDITNLWVTANEDSKQYQQYTFTYTADNTSNSFSIDVQAEPDILVKNLLVYLNNQLLDSRIYSLIDVETTTFSGTNVVINATLTVGDKIDVFVYSMSGSNTIGYYEIPANLENNAQNALLTSFTLGQYRSHISNQFEYSNLAIGQFPGFPMSPIAPTIIDTADTTLVSTDNSDITADNLSSYAQATSLAAIYAGDVANQTATLFADSTEFDADNTYITADEFFLPNYVSGGLGVTTQNLRDLPTISQFPGTIIQNSAGLHYAELFLTDDNYNFVNAIRQARQDYSTFKIKFLQAATVVPNIDLMTPLNGVDAIISYLNSNKDSTFPYYYSDMVPYGTSKLSSITYTVSNPSQMQYNVQTVFDNSVPSNISILVYRNGNQLVSGIDYTFSSATPTITFTNNVTFNENDVILLNYYSNTDGSWIPETPTKLGMYPKYTPRIITDNTYETSVQMIVGHDGSNTPVFNDFRDALLLELELRIFNNIKVSYDINKLDFNTIVPGKFRTTDYSLNEVNSVLSTEFLTWATNNNVDYTDNEWFLSGDFFTWNFSNFADKDGDALLGYWRGIYRYFYDTDHPDTRPWEMLGFTQMPSYWVNTYGPAPYTSGNLVLWQDLANGYVAGGPTQGTYPEYARPELLNYIPVDDFGNLLPPNETVSGNYDPNLADENFVFGDCAPAENAWRYSSDYPYAIQIMMALLKPAKYFGLFIDSNYQKNLGLNQFVFENNIRFQQTDIEINGTTPTGSTTIQRVASYTNWIADYVRGFGINPQTTLVSDVEQMSIQLAYKMASFSDQTYITPILEQSSPGASSTGILVPIDNYSIPLIKSTPVTTAAYSAVIVELTDVGYAVRGYDNTTPYFNIIPSNPTGNSYNITQSGVSATIYQDYTPTLVQIPYGTTFTSKQQLVDFLVSYQRYLNAIGFVFQQTSAALNQQQDWILSANEFLVWSQQGWSIGSAIVLSPAATQLQILSTNTVVDTIQNVSASSRALDTNFKIIDSTRYTVLRDSDRGLLATGANAPNLFQFNTVDGTTIALLTVNLVQWEHAIVFDNVTTFNDIIYQPSTDQRQYRIRLNGYKTNGWNGAINPSGFFINQDNVQIWQPSSTYNLNDLVQYKGVYYVAKQQVFPASAFNFNYWQQINYDSIKTGLIPNFANTATQYKNFYNVDYVDFNEESDEFAKHLIGFQQRDYLTNLDVESSSQLKFYQGFIAQKGTINSIDAFTSAQFGELNSNIDLYEEWAFRVGSYGATNTSSVVEVQLNNSTFTGNPQIIAFSATSVGTNLGTQAALPSNEISIPILTVTPNELYKIPAGWNSAPFITGVEVDVNQQIQTAGYVRLNDIDASVFDITNIDSIGSIIPNIGSGYHIWTANDFNNTWNVFRVSETNLHITTISNALDGLIQLSLDGYHNLVAGDIIAIKNFSSVFDGFYQVSLVIDLENILVTFTGGASSLSGFVQSVGDGLLFKLSSVRFTQASDVADFTPLNGWLNNDLVWIDNYETENNWAVLLKQQEYAYDQELVRPASFPNANFGSSIGISTNGLYAIVGSPGGTINYTTGSVALYLKNPSHQFVSEADLGILSTGINNLGTAVVTMPNGFAVSAPASGANVGYVYIGTAATQASSTISYNQVFAAPNLTPNSYFGQSMDVSEDGYSLYIGAPGINTVYYYQLVADITPDSASIVVDKISVEYTIPFVPAAPQSIFVSDENDNVFINGIDYTVNGSVLTFVNAPQNVLIVAQNTSYYQYVSAITANDSVPGDNFGISIACNNDGSSLYIAAPNNVGTQFIQKSGAVYVFYRVQQAQTANGSSTVYPSTLAITATTSVSLDGIIQNSQQVIPNTTNNTVDFTYIPLSGQLITINYGTFQQIQKVGDNIIQPTTAFGTSIDYDYVTGTLVVGSPNETIDEIYYSGSVYRFINTESIIGSISTISGTPVPVNGDVISINDYFVSVSGTTLASLVNSINNANIPNITASVTNGVMTITSNSSSSYQKLKVIPIKGNTYSTLGFMPYVMYQKISNPIPRSLSMFGTTVNIPIGGQNLFVGNPLATTYESTTFDAGLTVFDAYTTEFVDSIQNSGSVVVFDLLPGITNTETVSGLNVGNFVEVQQLVSSNINVGDNFGATVTVYDNSVFVGSPMAYDRNDNAGIVQEFTNSTGELGWTVYRFKPETIAQNAINKLFMYDTVSDSIITEIECIDPIYGLIPGEARQNIDFLTNYDPASYEFINNTASGIVLNSSALWGDKQVGLTWWDLSTVRYVEYHQGEEEYRAANWASVMAGSSVDVYEWVESIYLPSQYVLYVGDGTPKFPDDSTYTEKVTYDSVTGAAITTYYYWVVNKTSINVTSPKTLPVYDVAQLILNPLGQGISYAAILDTDAIALYNLVSDIDSTNTILHIDYATSTNVIDSNIHNQYALVAQGSPSAIVPVNIINKLVDSLSGVDKLGNVVPDPTILVSERYGINIRPRQSMIVDNLSALESFVQYVNGVCLTNQIALSKSLSLLESSAPIPPAIGQDSIVNYNEIVPDYTTLTYLDTINLPVGYIVLVQSDFNFNGIWVIYQLNVDKQWITTSMQSYNTADYWQYANWYSPDYVAGVIPTYTVATKYDLQMLQNLSFNDIVQVNDNGTGNFEIVQFIGQSITDNAAFNEFNLLALENGTIQFDSSLYDYVDNGFGFDNERFDVQPWDQYPVTETRNIITAVLNDIFINDLSSYFNDLFFVMVNYILSEQKYVDWVFKTSFISIVQQIRELSQVPLYQPDNQTYLEDYINEVKPYHTNIRQFILDYYYREMYNGDVTDFDLPSYYDATLGYFRSPDGEYASDALLLETAPQYRDWYNNYQAQQLLSIEVIDGGSGYVTAPQVIVSGGGGLGATAYATINTSGQVTSINIVYGGSNFNTAPNVFIEGGGGFGAMAKAFIGNNLIRNINTTLKFDRITYGTTVVPWTPNTEFYTGQIISYNNLGYILNPELLGTGTADDTYITGDNADISADETIGHYVSGETFSAADFTLLNDSQYGNANDRIMVYYQPVSGMAGLDLAQLQSGIDYPGIILDGLRFEDTPLFDLPAFDIYPFDATDIGPEGFPEPSDIVYDSIYTSAYVQGGITFDSSNVSWDATNVTWDATSNSSYLGINPSDIVSDGGPYMGGFNSYAPEELVSVSNYDTLDMKVLTLDPSYPSPQNKGIPISNLVYPTDGVTKQFSYSVGNSLGDTVLVYTRNTGARTYLVDYTIDWVNRIVTFLYTPAAGDDIIIYVIDDAGANEIFAGDFVVSSTNPQIFMNVPFEAIQDSLVLYNGSVTAAYTLSLAPDGRNTILTVNLSKFVNWSVHVHLYSQPLVATDVHVQTITMPSVITSSNYTINLERTVYDVGPWGGQIIVQQNNNRLIPTNTAYYVGDGSTTVFESQTTVPLNPSLVSATDFDVWVNGEPYTLNQQYTVLPAGTGPREIQFLIAPAVNSQISIGLTTQAQYTFITNSQIKLNQSLVTLNPGDIITINTFSNQDTLGIRTQVYEGGQITQTQELLGFSEDLYDSIGFDSTTTISLIEPLFTLSRPAVNMNYLFVTYNGRRLYPNFDFVMQTPTTLLISSVAIQPTDTIIVTSFTETVQQAAIGFRMFKDMNDNWYYLRLSEANTTTLAQPLNITDTQIFVEDASVLSTPNLTSSTPGVIFIGGERITYWTINTTTNVLGQLRRGTLGTGATQATIPAGTLVEDAGVGQMIPDAAGVTWYQLGTNAPSNGNSLIVAETTQANFLKEEPSFYFG